MPQLQGVIWSAVDIKLGKEERKGRGEERRGKEREGRKVIPAWPFSQAILWSTDEGSPSVSEVIGIWCNLIVIWNQAPVKSRKVGRSCNILFCQGIDMEIYVKWSVITWYRLELCWEGMACWLLDTSPSRGSHAPSFFSTRCNKIVYRSASWKQHQEMFYSVMDRVKCEDAPWIWIQSLGPGFEPGCAAD